MLIGTLSYVSLRGFGFAEVVSPIGFVDRYFVPRSRVIRNPQWFAQGATVQFELNPAPSRMKEGLPEAIQVEVIKSADGQTLDNRVLQGEEVRK